MSLGVTIRKMGNKNISSWYFATSLCLFAFTMYHVIHSIMLSCLQYSLSPTQSKKQTSDKNQWFSTQWVCSYCLPLNGCLKILRQIVHATFCGFFFAPFWPPRLRGFLFRLPAAALFRANFPMAHRFFKSGEKCDGVSIGVRWGSSKLAPSPRMWNSPNMENTIPGGKGVEGIGSHRNPWNSIASVNFSRGVLWKI